MGQQSASSNCLTGSCMTSSAVAMSEPRSEGSGLPLESAGQSEGTGFLSGLERECGTEVAKDGD